MRRRASRRLALWTALQRVVAALFLPPAYGVALCVGLLIRLHSPGPILVRLSREGKDGVCFPMYKLRTMVIDADAALRKCLNENEDLRREWQQFGRLACDPRIAGPVARQARRFSIDELPQILDVVCGRMALVGPRPLPVEVAARMRPDDRKCRQTVLPGITGLWQISGRSELSIDAMGSLDRLYVRKRTILRDVGILLRTPWAVASGRGAY
jgi:exopolysaccharide production protein ExoY